jgi:hypothetical protein
MKWRIVNDDFSTSPVDWSKNQERYTEELRKWNKLKLKIIERDKCTQV